MKYTSAMFALVFLAGCSATNSTTEHKAATNQTTVMTAQTDKNEDKVRCTKEKKSGSNMSRRVCRTIKQMDEEQKAASNMMRSQGGSAGRIGDK